MQNFMKFYINTTRNTATQSMQCERTLTVAGQLADL